MTTTDDARKAHDLLDDLDARAELSQEQEKLLRSFLPERSKPKTLDDIYSKVSAAWATTAGNSWGQYETECSVSLEAWLGQLRNDLAEIIETEEALSPPALPALPDGMRLADHEEYGRVVVSPRKDDDDEYPCFYLNGSSWGAYVRFFKSSDLTFIDAEPAKPVHPEFLETEADYRDAPEGTVAARDGWLSWIKEGANYWTCSVGAVGDCSMTQSQPRRILRWGWGE